jgi:hypothetical protein
MPLFMQMAAEAVAVGKWLACKSNHYQIKSNKLIWDKGWGLISCLNLTVMADQRIKAFDKVPSLKWGNVNLPMGLVSKMITSGNWSENFR